MIYLKNPLGQYAITFGTFIYNFVNPQIMANQRMLLLFIMGGI